MIDHLKYIFVLIGQKGSGKSLIGSIIQELYGITFLRVENIALDVKKERDVFDESYHKEVYSKIEFQIRKQLENNPAVIFESTGLAKQYDTMIKNLERDFTVTSIYVKSDPVLCIERIKKRDASLHINVSDKDAYYINQLVLEKEFNCDYTIENIGSREELVKAIKHLKVVFKIKEKSKKNKVK